MKCKNHRYLLAQPRKGSQVEVATVQVVTVNNIRALWRNLQDPLRPGKIKILHASPPIQ
jgi:hypothetical protein